MSDPEIKYEKIAVKDIEKGDIIYYKQRQEGNLVMMRRKPPHFNEGI